MKRFLTLLLIAILFTNCRTETADNRFYGKMKAYPEKRMALLPEIPFNDIQSILQNPTIERFETVTTYLDQASKNLNKIKYDELNIEAQEVYDIYKEDIDKCLSIIKDAPYLWDPSFYNAGGIVKHMTTYPIQDTCEQLTEVYKNLKIIPSYYETARSNLKKPSIKKTLLAIEKNSLGFHFLKNEVMDSSKIIDCERINDSLFVENHARSLIAIKDYVAFCNSLKFEYGEKNSKIVFRDSL